ncbi:MAG: hypothetical protein EOP38_15365, partial [Rubrivivax sp.]
MMSALHQLKLGPRLNLGFGMVLLLAALIATVGWLGLGGTISDIDDNAAMQRRATTALRWESLTLLNVNRTLAVAEAGGLKDVKDHFAPLIKETSAQISLMQKELEASSTSPEEKAEFADIALAASELDQDSSGFTIAERDITEGRTCDLRVDDADLF